VVADVQVGEMSLKATVVFDPDRVAYLEVEGLKAYYEHEWLRCFQMIIALMHEQFGFSWLHSAQAAYYVTRASIAWAPRDNDRRATHRYIRKFYRLAAKHGKGYGFEPNSTGDLEYRYWVLHRIRGNNPESDPEPYHQSLARLHSAIFGISVEQARPSAVYRAQATDAIDHVTGKRSTDIPADWLEAEDRLRAAYRSIAELL
jgi:hypothetical protein